MIIISIILFCYLYYSLCFLYSSGFNVTSAMTAYLTVLTARKETMRLSGPPHTVMHPHDLHKHITDYITILEYQFEALHLDKFSLLVRGGRLSKLHFLTMIENATAAMWV